MNNVFHTPIALIIFNRPETTQRVFDQIAKVRPSRLMVVGDGPRESRIGEKEKVEAARAIVNRVNWPCEVSLNFSDINLGCKNRVSSGIDWVFQQVSEAIILEDDCLPDVTFFRYCEELLELYRNNKKIAMISGDNFQFGQKKDFNSYYFSKYPHIWGWATWSDRWNNTYDVNIRQWPKIRSSRLLFDYLGGAKESKYWTKIFDRVYANKIDTWDYQWVLANWIAGRLVILPTVNLISNIGFSIEATHTTHENCFANLPLEPIIFPLVHPKSVEVNISADEFTKKNWFLIPLWKKVLNRLSSLFNRQY